MLSLNYGGLTYYVGFRFYSVGNRDHCRKKVGKEWTLGIQLTLPSRLGFKCNSV